MREALCAIRPAWHRARRTLLSGMIVLAVLLLPYAIPSTVFVDVNRLEFIPQGAPVPGSRALSASSDRALQARRTWWPVRLHWSARVSRIVATGAGDTDRLSRLGVVTECIGSGDWTYEPADTVFVMPLTVWTGDRECQLGDGTYELYGQWTYSFLIWSWTTTARSEIFTISGRGPG